MAAALAVPPLGAGGAARRPADSALMLADAAHDALRGTLARSPVGARLFAQLAERPAGLPAATIAALPANARRILRGVARARSGSCRSRRPSTVVVPPAVPFNADQRHAVAAIMAARGTFAPFVLFGVTGSGKTDVYLDVAAQLIAAGGQVLLLVPEINLTPQLEQRVRAALPDAVDRAAAQRPRRRRAAPALARGGLGPGPARARHAARAVRADAVAVAHHRRRRTRRVVQAAGQRALPRARRRGVARASARRSGRAGQRDAVARIVAACGAGKVPEARPAAARRSAGADAGGAVRGQPAGARAGRRRRNAARGARRRASRAASSRWCSSIAAASRRRCCARPAAGKRTARAAARGSPCIARRPRCAVTTAATTSACRRLSRLRQCRPAAAGLRHAAAGAGPGRGISGGAHRAHRPRQHALARRVRSDARPDDRQRTRHPDRHADAGEGPRFPAADAGWRAGCRQRAVQRGFSRHRASRRAADAGRRSRGARRPGRRSHHPDRFSRPSRVRGDSRARLRAPCGGPAGRATDRPVAAVHARSGACGGSSPPRRRRRFPACRACGRHGADRRDRQRRSRSFRRFRRCSRVVPDSNAGRSSCKVRAGRRCSEFLPAWREALVRHPGRRVRWALDVDPAGFA